MENIRTEKDIEQSLAELGASPENNGMLELIVCRPEIDERKILETGELNTEIGLVGDNWKVRKTSYTADGQINPLTQITIMNSRIIQAISQDPSRWAIAGDQLFVDLDLSSENLPAGQKLAIGTAILEVSEMPHTGCGKFTERFGSGATHFINSKEGRAKRRRGLNARVIQAGTIHTGDTVRKIDE